MKAANVRMARLVLELSNKIKFEKLSGQVLKNRTGTLRRSIRPLPVKNNDSVLIGEVVTNLEYARIHEFGGKTKAHDIFPKKGRALAFMMGGKQVIVKSVKHPGSVMPERSFMRTALNEMTPQIREVFENAVGEVVARLRSAA
jgi:phage gpG-like protein